VTTPAQQQQQHHHNESNKVIATIAKMPGLQRGLCIYDGNTIVTRAMTPAQQQQRSLHIHDGDVPIVTRATMPA
jgi:hypothetical protein